MREEYDFSESRKNPYAAKLSKRIALRVDVSVIDYFKTVAQEVGVPYQSLIKLYLSECAAVNKRLNLPWR